MSRDHNNRDEIYHNNRTMNTILIRYQGKWRIEGIKSTNSDYAHRNIQNRNQKQETISKCKQQPDEQCKRAKMEDWTEKSQFGVKNPDDQLPPIRKKTISINANTFTDHENAVFRL